MPSFSIKHLFRGEIVIWVVFMLLSLISLLEVFSAGSTLAYKSGGYMNTLYKQATYIAVAAAFAWGVHHLSLRFLRIIPSLGYLFSFILLVITAISGSDINGAARWASVGGINFQPSEVAKIALVALTAFILSKKRTESNASKKAIMWIAIFSLPILGMIALENLSTAALLAFVILLMMLIGRVPLLQLGKWLGTGLIILVIAAGTYTIMSEGDPKAEVGRSKTWENRIKDYLKPRPADPRDYDTDKDGQKAHAYIAIASSNMKGLGVGNSVERDFLSQAYSDFIYAIILEELGLLGGIGVAFLYTVILLQAGRIAGKCPTNYPAYLVMGLALMLTIQALVNMLVAVGIIPVTGQPLPLISRGGTSLLCTGIIFGIILSVSRYARKNPEDSEEEAEVEASLADKHVNEAEFLEDEGIS